MAFIVEPFAFILVSVFVMHDSVSLPKPIVPLTIVDTAVLVFHYAKVLGLGLPPLTLVEVAAWKGNGAAAIEVVVLPFSIESFAAPHAQFSLYWLVVFPFPIKSIAVRVRAGALSGAFAVDKLPCVGGAFSVILHRSNALDFVLVELSLVFELPYDVDKLSLPLLESIVEIAFVTPRPAMRC